MQAFVLVAIAVASQVVQGGADCRSEVTVVVEGFRNARGQAAIALFRNTDGFPAASERAYRRDAVAIQNNSATTTFRGLPCGKYAVSALHDENRNGKMDRNFVGMPKEGYGVSNDARPKRFGPPEFAEAAIELNTTPRIISIRLRYP
jgi:uncharacterized protein (DUF2141 family)